MTEVNEIVAALGLEPLPIEGGLFTRSWGDERCSAIYYLLAAPEFSALHRLDRVEIFVFHAGAPVVMHLLLPDGQVRRHVLGPDVRAGQRPQVVVPAGVWQAAETTGGWSLLGCVVVPPYTDDCVEFGSVAELAGRCPVDLLARLCKLG